MGGEGDDGVVDGQAEEGGTQPRLNGDMALRPGPQSLHVRQGPTHTTTPGSLQGEYRAGGRVHTPSRVVPPVGRHQLPTSKAADGALLKAAALIDLPPWALPLCPAATAAGTLPPR